MNETEAATVHSAVAAVRRGNHEAFEPIVDLYERRLFGLALMMTREPTGAEEVVQDAFVRAFQHLDAYDIHRPFYPWISTITVRLAQNWLIRSARRQTREGAELNAEEDSSTGEIDPLTGLITDERDRRLWASVSDLSSGERTALILHYRQDMSVGEIASALGVAGGTVKTLLFRGRQKLRLRLADLAPGKESV